MTADSLARAGEIALALREWGGAGGSWHFNHVLQIYASARANPDPLERIRRFSRCVEGLISGETKRHFIARTETFIGANWQKEVGSIYDVRSAVEHLREYGILEPASRSSREDLLPEGRAYGTPVPALCRSRLVDQVALVAFLKSCRP